MMEGQPKYQYVSPPPLEINIWNCHSSYKLNLSKNAQTKESPGGPMVNPLCFHCEGLGFHPWSGN